MLGVRVQSWLGYIVQDYEDFCSSQKSNYIGYLGTIKYDQIMPAPRVLRSITCIILTDHNKFCSDWISVGSDLQQEEEQDSPDIFIIPSPPSENHEGSQFWERLLHSISVHRPWGNTLSWDERDVIIIISVSWYQLQLRDNLCGPFFDKFRRWIT